MHVLITGASKGIGLALAHEFAKHGHDLVLVARDEALLQKASSTLIEQYKIKAVYQVCDLSQSGSALYLYNSLKEQGITIQCLVNNAGIGYLGNFVDMEGRLNDLMQINMIAPSELTRLYLKDFLAQNEGYILQISSTAGFIPGPFMAAYYASKAYITTLSQAIDYEIKGTKVSVSIVCPGATKTNFFHEANMDRSKLEKGFSGMMTPEQVAKVAYDGMMRKKLFIIPGVMNKIMVFLISVSPKRMVEAIVARLHRKD